jgi:hypothetical protein
MSMATGSEAGAVVEVGVLRGRRRRGNLLRGLGPQRPQQAHYDRMLSRSELIGMPLGKSTEDGQCRQLRLGRKPTLDRGNVRVEHGGHADPGLVTPFGPPLRGARLTGLDRLTERLDEGGRLWRVRCGGLAGGGVLDLAGPAVEARAEQILCRADLGQESNGIERAIERAQTLFDMTASRLNE